MSHCVDLTVVSTVGQVRLLLISGLTWPLLASDRLAVCFIRRVRLVSGVDIVLGTAGERFR